MNPDTQISIVVIAKNEADRIGHLLNHCEFAHEVIVVDSGSTDETVALCESKNAKVIHHPWQGYADQKQFAMEQAKCPWILNLDADEYVPDELAQEIQSAVASAPPAVAAYSMPRLSYYLGRWIRHGGWYPDRKVRLMRKGAGHWTGDGIHEKLVIDGESMELSNPLHHLVYRNIADQIKTVNSFSDVYARHRKKAGPLFLAAGIPHTFGKFFECFIWKRGFLDGWAGLVIAMISSGYIFLKHAKAWERHQEFNASDSNISSKRT